MPACAACRRPVAMARPTCVYCGAPLPAEVVDEAARGAEAAAAPAPVPDLGGRWVIIVDMAQAEEGDLARTLGISAFEAGQRRRRGGFQFHRIAAEGEARAEADALRAGGLGAFLVPEAEARTPPVLALGG